MLRLQTPGSRSSSMIGKFSEIFIQHLIEYGRLLKERRVPGAGDSLTLSAPKVLEGNAIEVVEIDEWVLGAIQYRNRHRQRFDQLPLIGAHTGSTSLEQSASGYAVRPNE